MRFGRKIDLSSLHDTPFIKSNARPPYGYINFGVLGAFVFLIIALSLCIFVANRLDGAYFSIVIPYVWQLNNSALFSTFFGHGFVFLVVWALYNAFSSQGRRLR